jgi:hypothetical protein
MLKTELGIEPTAQLTSLVANLGRRHSDP